MTRSLAAAAAAVTLFAAPALAGAPVELRDHPIAGGPAITLGDLFDGVEGPGATVAVARSAPTGQDAVLDAGAVQLAARRAGYDWPNASGFHRIVVGSVSGGSSAGRAVAGVRSRGRVLVWARDVAAGQMLQPSDLRWSREAARPDDEVADADLVIGKAARRAVREGDPAAMRDVMSPILVHRDDLVSVVFEADGVSLTLQAKAMGDAVQGQTLEVLNTTSKKVIEAVCSGPDQAFVGPLADAVKAAARSATPRFTAVLR